MSNSIAYAHIELSSLRVEPFELNELLEVSIIQKFNNHATLYIKGTLPDGTEPGSIVSSGEAVKLVMVDGDDSWVLFHGIADCPEIEREGAVSILELYARSHSSLMDICRKSRSFQDKQKAYIALMEQVAHAYPGGGIMDKITENATVDKFIMQHNETDWEFMTRMASHFNTGLSSAIRFDGPKAYMGVPKIAEHVLDYSDYKMKRDMEKYRELSQNGVKGISERDFDIYMIRTGLLPNIGDRIKFEGKELYVYEINSTSHEGLLENHLSLCSEKGFSQPLIPCRASGASYSGHITAVRNDQVQLALATDAGHDPGTPCWFAYSTIYSSKDGSGWYCMPELGDTARLHFPDGDDNSAYAQSSVHEHVDEKKLEETNARGGAGGGMRASGMPGGGYSGKRDNPEVKSLRNKDGKEIQLTPEGIFMIVDGTIVTMTEDGLLVMTDNDIEFKSEKNIILAAEEDVNLVGYDSMDLSCSDTTSVTLTDNVQITGHEVLAN